MQSVASKMRGKTEGAQLEPEGNHNESGIGQQEL